MTTLGIIWFFLIFLLIAGYFILDGFDLGVMILQPFIAKSEGDKAICHKAVGPFWDGNEVWLLTAGGALFAAFPAAYATTFSGFYLAIMLVLFSLIVRAVAIEWGHHDPSGPKIWDALAFIGSALPALLLGVALGCCIHGIPMDSNGDYSGIPLLGLLNVFTLLCGVLGLLMFIAAGAAWLCVKAPVDSEVYAKAQAILPLAQTAALVVFVLTFIYGACFMDYSLYDNGILMIARIAFVAIFALSMAANILLSKSVQLTFVLQSLAAAALPFLAGCSMFPRIVLATSGSDITIATAASTDYTLMWMTGITVVCVPIMLVYHVIAHRIFAGKVDVLPEVTE